MQTRRLNLAQSFNPLGSLLRVIFFQNIWGLYSLGAVSACMSLMFPTIYGIALKGMGEDAKFGAAGLIMAILGGSILPPASDKFCRGGMVRHKSL